MVFDLVGRVIARARYRAVYERNRVKKVVPVLFRYGISELEGLYERFNRWRGTVDHIETRKRTGTRRKTKIKVKKR